MKDTIGFYDLMDAIDALDPKWHGNPPRPGTSEWIALSREDQLELIPRFARSIRINPTDINKLGDKETIAIPDNILGGLQVVENKYMPTGMAVMLDAKLNVLAVIDLTK